MTTKQKIENQFVGMCERCSRVMSFNQKDAKKHLKATGGWIICEKCLGICIWDREHPIL